MKINNLINKKVVIALLGDSGEYEGIVKDVKKDYILFSNHVKAIPKRFEEYEDIIFFKSSIKFIRLIK